MKGAITPLSANGRVWIEVGNRSLIGTGKMQLLRTTAQLGSLRQAALKMKMSYRQAWYSIYKINQTTDQPLINLKRGGKKGGVAELTAFGKEILELFNNLETRFDAFLKEQTRELNQ